ncbi:MAG: sulfur oxidation c-type cytochrome SoxX [Proteobacteria bacterium]|nr:sulfur oxidation c-type cytochrome SoxX [Pseudomonadota bacterium]
MRYTAKLLAGTSAMLVIAGSLLFTPAAYAVGEMPSKKVCASTTDTVVKGGCVMTDRKKGNCMACHRFAGLEKTRLQAGNIAPPLVAIKQNWSGKGGKSGLRKQVSDSTASNPNSSMPPFGRHKILSNSEIDQIVEFLWTL